MQSATVEQHTQLLHRTTIFAPGSEALCLLKVAELNRQVAAVMVSSSGCLTTKKFTAAHAACKISSKKSQSEAVVTAIKAA